MTSLQPATKETRRFFDKHRYYLAENVFSPSELVALEEDFDRTVAQLQGSSENVNVR